MTPTTIISATISIDLVEISAEGVRFDQALDDELSRARESLLKQWTIRDLTGHSADEIYDALDYARQKGWRE